MMHLSVSSKQGKGLGKKVFINIPHLIQSTTKEREESASIVTLNTPTGSGYATNEDTDYDTSSYEPSDTFKQHDFRLDEDESSSSSSDWELSSSMASSYLPRDRRKANHKSMLKPYASIIIDVDEGSQQIEENTTNDVLFYPYSNLQSLLFSHSHCYIETDYKKIKNVNINDEDDGNTLNNSEMNWTDLKSVQKLKELIHNLLISASLTVGIREEEIYLMFNSPSPLEIIQELRFGLLADLCDVHMDRFGRRSFYRKDIDYVCNNNKHLRNNVTHFYNHSHIPSNLFASNDINNLSNFVQESPRIYHSPFTQSTESPSASVSSHIQRMSEDKLEWKNIDYKPVTYLLTKTKTNINPFNPNRTATDIASKHNRKKTNHKMKSSLSALHEQCKQTAKQLQTNNTKVSVSKKMSVEQFKSMDLAQIFVNDNMDNMDIMDNYAIAKTITQYFDRRFDDTDTVCLVSEVHKHPAISYWIKGQYVRKGKGALRNKYVLVYRSSKHAPAKQPIVSQQIFEQFVKDLSVKYEHESVDFIGEKLDDRFGVGCHYVRSTQKNGDGNDYDVYCRFSNQYECSFKLTGKTQKFYVIAWRR